MKFRRRAVATCLSAVQKIAWVVFQFALYRAGAICLGDASTCLWDLCEAKAGGCVRARMSGCLCACVCVCVWALVSVSVRASACLFDSSLCMCVCVFVRLFVCFLLRVRLSPPKFQGICSYNISTAGGTEGSPANEDAAREGCKRTCTKLAWTPQCSLQLHKP